MQKYFSKAQGIGKFIHLSNIFITIGALSSSSIAYADVNGIPFNPDFKKAEYPYAQAPDACSGVTDRPDSNGEIRDTWGPVDFRGACNTHDKCYYTVGSNWNTCNERLYSDLRAACERDLRISFNVPAPTLTDPLRTRRVDGPPDPARLAACYTTASGYYAGVQLGVAVGVFNKAQDKQRRYESWVASIKNPTSSISTPSWQKYLGSGLGQSIAVSQGGRPVVIGTDQRIYRGSGSGWVELSGGGTGTDIAIDGGGKTWVIGTDKRIYFHNGSAWQEYPGGGLGQSIAVSQDGSPVVIGTDQRIYRGSGSGWVELSGGGRGMGIAIDGGGKTWVIGTDKAIYSHP